MGVIERLRGSNGSTGSDDALVSVLRDAVAQREESLDLLMERLAELELSLEDEGWMRLGLEGERDFSSSGLKKIRKLAKLMFLKNPLIRRAVMVQTYYVMGQGVQIEAADPDVDAVVQGFLGDRGNKSVIGKHQARSDLETDLQTQGELFFTLFTNPSSGRVVVRMIHPDEITEIITNPEDAADVWFFRRDWTARTFDVNTGRWSDKEQTVYYPDADIPPDKMVETIGDKEVQQDARVVHVKVGGTSGMTRGLPDVYAAMDWAKAYKGFLEDTASLYRALTKFAWRLTTKGKGVKAAKDRFASTLASGEETNPAPAAGGVFVGSEDVGLQAVPKSGASISPEDGRHLRTMVAAGTDIPDTILAGDPDMGNLATAKTLDRPTELAMRDRQTLWADVYRDLLDHVVVAAVKAKKIPGGKIEKDDDGREIATFPDETDPTIRVTFPPILEHDVAESVGAIVKAATLDGKTQAGTMPAKTLVRMLLTVLGEEDVDSQIDELFPDGEEPVDPNAPPPEEEEPPATEAEMLAAVRELRIAVGRLRGEKPSE